MRFVSATMPGLQCQKCVLPGRYSVSASLSGTMRQGAFDADMRRVFLRGRGWSRFSSRLPAVSRFRKKQRADGNDILAESSDFDGRTRFEGVHHEAGQLLFNGIAEDGAHEGDP